MVRQPVPNPTAKRKVSINDTPPSEILRPSKKQKQNHVPDSASSSYLTPTYKRLSQKNAVAGPSTQKESPSPSRISSRVPKPTMKKMAAADTVKKKPPRVFVEDPILSDSDSDELPRHILPLPSRKQAPSKPPKKPEASPNRKVKHLGAFELSSEEEDDARTRPPRKRVKTSIKPTEPAEVIDLCSDDQAQLEEAIQLPTRLQANSTPSSSSVKQATLQLEGLTSTSKKVLPKRNSPRKKDGVSKNVAPVLANEVVEILSTDDEAGLSAISQMKLPVHAKDGRSASQTEKMTTPGTTDASNPISEEVQDMPLPDFEPLPVERPSTPPVQPRPPLVFVSPPNVVIRRRSEELPPLEELQESYKRAMEERASSSSRGSRRRNSAFMSVEFSPPKRVISFSDLPTSPTLNTPSYFSRSLLLVAGSPTSSKKPSRTSPSPNSPVMDIRDAGQMDKDSPSERVPVPDLRLPPNHAEELPFVPAEEFPMNEGIEEIQPSSVDPANVVQEDTGDLAEATGPMSQAIEYIDTVPISQGEPISSKLPSGDSSPEDEAYAALSEWKDDQDERMLLDASVSAQRQTTDPSPDVEEIFKADKSFSTVVPDESPSSSEPPSIDNSVLVKDDIPVVRNGNVILEAAQSDPVKRIALGKAIEQNTPPLMAERGLVQGIFLAELLQAVNSTKESSTISSQASQAGSTVLHPVLSVPMLSTEEFDASTTSRQERGVDSLELVEPPMVDREDEPRGVTPSDSGLIELFDESRKYFTEKSLQERSGSQGRLEPSRAIRPSDGLISADILFGKGDELQEFLAQDLEPGHTESRAPSKADGGIASANAEARGVAPPDILSESDGVLDDDEFQQFLEQDHPPGSPGLDEYLDLADIAAPSEEQPGAILPGATLLELDSNSDDDELPSDLPEFYFFPEELARRRSVPVDETGGVIVVASNQSAEEPPTAVEGNASADWEPQSSISLDPRRSPIVEDIPPELPLVLPEPPRASPSPNTQTTASPDPEDEELDELMDGLLDDTPQEIHLTLSADTHIANTVTILECSPRPQIEETSIHSPLPSEIPLQQISLPDSDPHDLAALALEDPSAQIPNQASTLFDSGDEPLEQHLPAAAQNVTSEDPEVANPNEATQTGSDPTRERARCPSEKNVLSFSDPLSASYQPLSSTSPAPLGDPVELSAAALPSSTDANPGVESSPDCSLTSSIESLSPVTPEQQHIIHPLIISRHPKAPGCGGLDCSDVFRMNMSALMSRFYKQDEFEDDVANLEFTYPDIY